jgi:hypothetical protein
MYASTVDILNAAIERGQETLNIQEYLEVRIRPANGVYYAWYVLTALAGVSAEEIDSQYGDWELRDRGRGYWGGTGFWRSSTWMILECPNLSSLWRTLYRPRMPLVGKSLTDTRKRNVVKMKLEDDTSRAFLALCPSRDRSHAALKVPR